MQPSRIPSPASALALAALAVASPFVPGARGNPNNWTNAGGGLWRVATNWSLAAAPDGTSNLDPTQITNAGRRTVLMDSATASANLTVRNLTLSAPPGSTNTLLLGGLAAPFATSKALLVGTNGVLQLTNSALSAQADFDVAGGAFILDSGSLDCALNCDLQSGALVVNGGVLNATVGATGIRMGRFAGADANFTVNGGTVNTLRVTLGSVTGSQNSLTIAGGNLNCLTTLSLGQLPGTTALGTMSAGNLIVTNGTTKIADRAASTFSQSGGNAAFADLSIGDVGVGLYELTGGQMSVTPHTNTALTIVGNLENGEFRQSGGVAVIHNGLHVSDFPGVTGTVSIGGGQFFATNDLVAIGRQGFGQMTVSNAVAVLTNTSVGRHLGATGLLTVQSNASVILLADLSVGRFLGSAGQVLVQAGFLSVTNDDFWVGRGGAGDLTVSGGTVRARSLHVGESDDGTNAPAGSVTLTGGTVFVSSNLTVGTSLLSTGHVAVAGGSLFVTNASGAAVLAIHAGDFTMNGGAAGTDSLMVTNADGNFIFNTGTLRAKDLLVANGVPFVVGDGVNPATLELLGGTATFADGLVIAPNATVSGCGTVIGNITNLGVYTNTCNTPPPPVINAMARNGNTASVSCLTVNGRTYNLEFKNSLSDAAWTPLIPGIVGNGGVMSIQDTTATTATRFYRIAVR